MAVEGPSKADISCHDNKDGTVAVTYLPTAPGEYKISVMFSDKHIKGSPYSAKITGKLFISTLFFPYIPCASISDIVAKVAWKKSGKGENGFCLLLSFFVTPECYTPVYSPVFKRQKLSICVPDLLNNLLFLVDD